MRDSQARGSGAHLSRRELVRAALGSSLLVKVVPLLGAATSLGLLAPGRAEAGLFDGVHARRTMSAFADTVIPPDATSPGGAAAGFVDVLYDPEFYAALIGMEVPVAPAMRVLVVDLDRRSYAVSRQRFADAGPEERLQVLKGAHEGSLELVYLAMGILVKVVYFGGQRSSVGFEHIGYPGASVGYPDACPAGPPPTHQDTQDGNPP